METMRRMNWGVTAVVAWMAVSVFAAGVAGQECPPCEEIEGRSVTSAKAQLSEAFRLSLDVTDCSEVASRDTCRRIDGLVEDVLEAVDAIFSGHVEATTVECLTCDPRPHLWPLIDGVGVLVTLLQEKGEQGFTDSSRSLLERLGNWKNFRCPCTEAAGSGGAGRAPRVAKRSREAEARAELTRKCGELFANGRMGLLQVFRAPDDRDGCYQSRACREPTVYQGIETKAGFWSYDGEFWYIWERRRGTAGRWLTCEN
jgi:hypothetical protein